jgi:SAM-dependent methyltransferase
MRPDLIYQSTDDVDLRRRLWDKGFADVDAVGKAADGLTARSPKTPQDMWRFRQLTSRAEKVRRAEGLRDRLVKYRKAVFSDILSVEDSLALELETAIVDRDSTRLTALGIDTGYAWLGDVVAAMVGGEYVAVETVGPYACEHVDARGRLRVSSDNLPIDERAGMLLAGLIRDATDGFDNVCLVALLDDHTIRSETGPLSVADRDLYVVEISNIFQQFGAIRVGDVPGERFVLLREAALVPESERLIAMLRDSGVGVVTERSERDIDFVVADSFTQTLALRSENRRKDLRRRGVALVRDGRSLCHTLDAASFLHPICHLMVHFKILDKRFAAEQDRTYALCRALGVLRQDNIHNVFFDSTLLSPALVTYAVCRLLEREVDETLRALHAFDDWIAVDPDEYVTRNYTRRILPEDRDIIAFAIEHIERAGLPERGAALVADVGSGPNFYPMMLLAPYVRDDGAIDMIEFSEANRGYAEGVLDDYRTPATREPWQRFENLMVKLGSPKYADAFSRACDRANVIEGSVYSLPKNRYDIVTSYFVAESITSSRRDFHRAIRSLALALKPNGLLVAAHMLGSTGWPAGLGKLFPAVPLTVADIEEAYRDAGLEFSVHRVDAAPADMAREGYHGMAAVVAHRSTAPVLMSLMDRVSSVSPRRERSDLTAAAGHG